MVRFHDPISLLTNFITELMNLCGAAAHTFKPSGVFPSIGFRPGRFQKGLLR